MIIKPVDDKLDLFLIEDILPLELLNRIRTEDFWGYDWEKQEMQSRWNRRRLLPDSSSPLGEVDVHYNHVLDQLEEVVGIKFTHKTCWSSFWLDYDGFNCTIHEDGAERNYNPLMAMQIYLSESIDQLGTVWYHGPMGKVRYAFPYKINTGYLMLNHSGQWHGMLNNVPPGHLRLSSYTYFGQFEYK